MTERYLNYLESSPADIGRMLEENPIAIVPFGALEWHGHHNVLGVDSLKATEICKRVIEKTGGVLLPCVNYGAFKTMKFPFTLHNPARPLKKMTKRLAKELYNWGFKIIVFLTGHYPKGQIKQVMNATKKISTKYDDCFAIGIPEQALVTDLGYIGDHAAKWETSLMMAINPEFVKLERMPTDLNFPERGIKHGVFGIDPSIHASKENGVEILNTIIDRLSTAIIRVRETKSFAPFKEILSNYKKGMKEATSDLKKLFELQGINEKREGLAFVYWWIFKRKKADPNYRYKEKN